MKACIGVDIFVVVCFGLKCAERTMVDIKNVMKLRLMVTGENVTQTGRHTRFIIQLQDTK